MDGMLTDENKVTVVFDESVLISMYFYNDNKSLRDVKEFEYSKSIHFRLVSSSVNEYSSSLS